MIRRRPPRFLMRRAGRPVPTASARRTAQGSCSTSTSTPTTTQEKTIAEAMQGDLLKIGVELRVIGEEKQAFLDRQPHGRIRPAVLALLGARRTTRRAISPPGRIPAHGDYQSQIGLADKAHIDATITALMTEADEKKRAAMVRDVLTRITDAAVYIPVSYSRTKAVYSNRIKDVSFAVTQYEIPFEKMSFTEAGK